MHFIYDAPGMLYYDVSANLANAWRNDGIYTYTGQGDGTVHVFAGHPSVAAGPLNSRAINPVLLERPADRGRQPHLTIPVGPERSRRTWAGGWHECRAPSTQVPRLRSG